jgi:sulfur carrier protein
MRIHVNGEAREVAEDLTVLRLLESLEFDPAQVAVELDRLIVKRAEWGERKLTPGARLEIVQFVGGG